MGKKRIRAKKTSKGQRRSVANGLVRNTEADRIMNRLEARLKGKKVATLIPNPNPDKLHYAPFIRVVQ